MSIPLAEAQTVTLDGSGRGSLRFGPTVYGLTWTITRMSTSGNSALASVTVDVYRGGESDTANIDHSDKANADISETTLPLGNGEFITVVYSGGTPGAQMAFRLEGTQEGRGH